jgi:predicted outer membrane repeat protein
MRACSNSGSRIRLAAAVALMWFATIAAPTACGTNFVVTSLSASGPGSFANALAQANSAIGPHAITFAVTGTIPVPTLLIVDRQITITGPGPTPAALVLDGGNTNQILNITADGTAPVAIRNLTIRNGRVANTNGGAVVVSTGAAVTLAQCVFSGNSTTSSGGALFNRGNATVSDCVFDGNTTGGGSGGAVYNAGTMTISASTFTANSAPNDGGAIVSDSSATLTVIDSAFVGNAANANGGGGGAIANEGVATVMRSSFSGNTGVGYGGAIRADASAIPNVGRFVIVNSTFSGNQGGSNHAGGGAIGSVNAGTVRIINSTITGNAAINSGGGGIYAGHGTTVELRNSIVSGNTATPGQPGPDCYGTVQSQGYNIVSDLTDCTIAGTPTGNVTGVGAGLAPLADNGGPTKTVALLPGSPALDGGDPAGCTDQNGAALTTDQRGIARPQGMACDSGAYEQATVLPSGRYTGLFWRAAPQPEAGWGINFAHQGTILFATWFTYGFDGKPLWFAAELHEVAPGVYSGGVFTSTGLPFSAVPWDQPTVETTVGSMTVAFSGSDDGVLTYTVYGVTQTKPITRFEFAGPVPSCTWDAGQDLALAQNFQDLWWNVLQPGWGINFTHQGDIIFATWFTYDSQGKPWWLIAELHKTAPGVYAGQVSAVTGPPFNAVPWSPTVEAPVGTAKVTFSSGQNATFDYTVNGTTQSKPITRFIFATPGTLCQ